MARTLSSGDAIQRSPKLLDVVEAAEALGTPVRFVRRLVAERRIRFYKVGRYVRIDQRDLDAFIDGGVVEAGPSA